MKGDRVTPNIQKQSMNRKITEMQIYHNILFDKQGRKNKQTHKTTTLMVCGHAHIRHLVLQVSASNKEQYNTPQVQPHGGFLLLLLLSVNVHNCHIRFTPFVVRSNHTATVCMYIQ